MLAFRVELGGHISFSYVMDNTKSKMCYECAETKPLNEFHKHLKMPDGHLNKCKVCQNLYSARRRAKHPDYMKEWHAKNRDAQKQYFQDNIEHYREYFRNWQKKRKLENPAHKLRMNLSSNLRSALKAYARGRAKSKSILKVIDCSLPELIQDLESKFLEGMTWENYGKWHVDHIKPLSAFENPEDSAAWCRANLQPLWAKDNIRKGGMNRKMNRDLYGKRQEGG